jgi:hypothetical protein
MWNKKGISFKEKLHIISLAETGVKNSNITKKLGCPVRLIQRVIKAQKRLPANSRCNQ